MFNEFERVVLTENLPELGLMGGDVGVVVMIHQDGKAYEVEFLTLSGDTVAVETLRDEQIRSVQEGDRIAEAIDTCQKVGRSGLKGVAMSLACKK